MPQGYIHGCYRESNMSEAIYWFYLEPYVHVFLKENRRVAFYNTLNADILEYNNENHPGVVEIARRLISGEGLYAVKICKNDLENPVLESFIDDVRGRFMGDIVNQAIQNTKPFQFAPILCLKNDFSLISETGQFHPSSDFLQYINELVFYINNACDKNCTICNEAFRQSVHCTKTGSPGSEISVESIEKQLDEASHGPLSSCSFTGGNILLYSSFERLSVILEKFDIKKKFHIHYLHLEDHNIKRLKSIWEAKCSLYVQVDFPLEKSMFLTALALLNRSGRLPHFLFAVRNQKDLAEAERIIDDYGINSYSFSPYFTGENLDFFEEFVFVDKEDILGAKPDQNDIFTRMQINPKEFGKLTFTCDGLVYANVNHAAAGKINEPLPEIVFKELLSGKSWRGVRGKVEPCQNCLYELLCPPLSNYEHVMGRNNLCHIDTTPRAKTGKT